MNTAESTAAQTAEQLGSVGLDGWMLILTVLSVFLVALTLGYAIGRNRSEDARREEALRPVLEVSAEQRAALTYPQGAGRTLGPPGASEEGVLEISVTNPASKERPVRPVALDLVPPTGGRLHMSGMDGDRNLGDEVAPGDRVRFWLPLDYLAWVLSELGNSGHAVRVRIEVRDALGNVHEGEAAVDVDGWTPPEQAVPSSGPYRPGDEVVFGFPIEHQEEVEQVLTIYEHREGEGPSDVYLYGHVSTEAEHGNYALSWVELSGEVPSDSAPGLYERSCFEITYPARGTIDLDDRLAPKTLEVTSGEAEATMGSDDER